jgi:hypothetical protein
MRPKPLFFLCAAFGLLLFNDVCPAQNQSAFQQPDLELPPSPSEPFEMADDGGLPPMIAMQSTGDGAPSSPTMSYQARTPAKTAGKPKPPPQPFKLCFFDNDFGYKKDPKHIPIFGENLKNISADRLLPFEPFEDMTISFGGELRYRYMDEANRLRAPFAKPGSATYDLVRWRNYMNVSYSDWFRAYIEMIDASANFSDLPYTGIDVNHWDIQNAFIDLKVLERNDKPVWLRPGRQELSFGSQRLISPLDWANTRRNFEGLRLNSPGTDWDLDAWITHPVNTATAGDGGGIGANLGVNNFSNKLDTANRGITFGGGWATYKGIQDHTIHTFMLFDHHDAFTGGAGFPVGDRITYGNNWVGTFNVSNGDRQWLTDVEGGYQFGSDQGQLAALGAKGSQAVSAGYFTGGLGHCWKSLPWEPTIWGFYDYASGSSNPKGGTDSTFFQYYGLTHAYLGLIDNIARQNITDANYRLTLKPTTKLQLMMAQHFFQLATANDTLYTVTGQPFGKTGNGTNVGNEIDFVGTYNYNQNFNLELGYFFFQYGSYVEAATPGRSNAGEFYVQTTFKY